MKDSILRFAGVEFAYTSAPVLWDVGFAVPAGTVTALMGPSGCGKSTIMLLAAGLLVPGSGSVKNDADRSAPMFQDPALLPWRNALDNVCFALKATIPARTHREARAKEALAAVGLGGSELRKYPRQLSGGMRQRVALARALAVAPDLLLLDEPFRALDPALARRMHGLVRQEVERRGASALVITHDAREVARIADQVVFMSAAPGTVRRVLDLPGLPGNRSREEATALSIEIETEAEACGPPVRNPRVD